MDTGSLFCCKCLELLSPPIKQCTNHHHVCGKCQTASVSDICPKCSNQLNAVSYNDLEKVIAQLNIEKVTFPCNYFNKGCSYKVEQAQKLLHEAECRFRPFECEGKRYCGWNCDWKGNYSEILNHFKHSHNSVAMKYTEDSEMRMEIDFGSLILKPIDYSNGYALFWYKHKVDVALQMVYWAIQYVGLQKDAGQYYYEFEMKDGPTRKIKVTEFCESDHFDANAIFKSGQCVALPFSTVTSFLSVDGHLKFRYRVMKVTKSSTTAKDEEASTVPSSFHQMNRGGIRPKGPAGGQRNRTENKPPYV